MKTIENKPHKPIRKPSIKEAVGAWLLYNHRHTRRTQGHYSYVIAKFISSLPKHFRHIDQIKVIHLQGYISKLLNDYSNRTANAHLTALRSFFVFLSSNYSLPNIAKDVKFLREDPPRQRCLNPAEYQSILKACKNQKVRKNRKACKNQKEKHLIIFLANTGLRATEMEELKWDNINDNLTLCILTGKGRRRRVVPLNTACREVLNKYPRKPETVIQFTKSADSQYKLISKLCRKCGFDKAGPHSLRHYYATELIKRGVNIKIVSLCLGHKSVSTTEKIYCHIQPTDLIGVSEVLCEKDNAEQKD